MVSIVTGFFSGVSVTVAAYRRPPAALPPPPPRPRGGAPRGPAARPAPAAPPAPPVSRERHLAYPLRQLAVRGDDQGRDAALVRDLDADRLGRDERAARAVERGRELALPLARERGVAGGRRG